MHLLCYCPYYCLCPAIPTYFFNCLYIYKYVYWLKGGCPQDSSDSLEQWLQSISEALSCEGDDPPPSSIYGNTSSPSSVTSLCSFVLPPHKVRKGWHCETVATACMHATKGLSSLWGDRHGPHFVWRCSSWDYTSLSVSMSSKYDLHP